MMTTTAKPAKPIMKSWYGEMVTLSDYTELQAEQLAEQGNDRVYKVHDWYSQVAVATPAKKTKAVAKIRAILAEEKYAGLFSEETIEGYVADFLDVFEGF